MYKIGAPVNREILQNTFTKKPDLASQVNSTIEGKVFEVANPSRRLGLRKKANKTKLAIVLVCNFGKAMLGLLSYAKKIIDFCANRWPPQEEYQRAFILIERSSARVFKSMEPKLASTLRVVHERMDMKAKSAGSPTDSNMIQDSPLALFRQNHMPVKKKKGL